MSRRANHEGSIHQRADGRWEARIQIGGKRRSVYGKTRKEVVALQQDLLGTARRLGHLPHAGRLTTGEFLTAWLDQAVGYLRPTTLASYTTLLDLHVLPDLGPVVLGRLSPLQVALHYGSLRKRGLSPRRVEMVHRVLHKALADAVTWRYLPYNPAASARIAKPERPVKVLWQPHEIDQFIWCLLDGKGGKHGWLFLFLLASGCRLGEALGLRWTDLDWERQTVRIERQRTEAAHRIVELPPKTAAGKRAVSLPDWGIEGLHRQHAQVTRWRLAATDWPEGEAIFLTETGRVPSQTNLRNAFHALCARLRLPYIPPHTLRHLHVSLLAQAGVPHRVAQARVGHAHPSVTLGIYTHVLGNADQGAAEAMEKVRKLREQ